MIDDLTKLRWYRLTPDRVVIELLVVEGLLWLSERFRWFGFNEKKGWTVLIGVAVVGGAMLVMLLWFVAAVVFRWRFQFSVRSLLVLVVIAAIPCSRLSVEMKRARKQREAVAAVEKLGGKGRVFWSGSLGPAWLQSLLGPDFLDRVVAVDLSNPFPPISFDFPAEYYALSPVKTIADADLQCFTELNDLEQLDLRGTKVTDAGVMKLQQALPNCRIIR